jgi:hypothetical protein
MSDAPASGNPAPAPQASPDEQKGTATPSKAEGNTSASTKESKPSRDDSAQSKMKAADEKFREAAELRKQVEDFHKKLENDPESFFNDPRIPKQKRREMAEKLLMKELEEEMAPQLTKEQQRLRELEEYRERKEKEELSAKEAKEQEEFAGIVKQRQEALANTFREALSHTALSKHEGTAAEVVREMAMYTRLCRQAGHNPSPKEIAEHVESRFMASYQGITETLSGEDLVKFLGKGIIKKLREYDLGQLDSRKDRSEPKTVQEWVPREERNSKRDFTSPKDLVRALRGK